MSRSRAPLYFGLAAAGGVGYYLYAAGGKPAVAEKQFEDDVNKARAKISRRGGDAETDAKKYGQEAGAKVDSALASAKGSAESYADRAKADAQRLKGDAEAYAKGARDDAMKKVDDADRRVEEKASQAKSGISSWFGGK